MAEQTAAAFKSHADFLVSIYTKLEATALQQAETAKQQEENAREIKSLHHIVKANAETVRDLALLVGAPTGKLTQHEQRLSDLEAQ